MLYDTYPAYSGLEEATIVFTTVLLPQLYSTVAVACKSTPSLIVTDTSVVQLRASFT